MSNDRLAPYILLTGLLVTIGLAIYTFTNGQPYSNTLTCTFFCLVNTLIWVEFLARRAGTSSFRRILGWLIVFLSLGLSLLLYLELPEAYEFQKGFNSTVPYEPGVETKE